MRTISKSLFAMMFSISLASGIAHAAPGDADDEPRITLLNPVKDSCASRGGLCVTAGAKTTRPVASWIAGGTGAAIPSGESALFLRVVAGDANKRIDEDSVPWTLDVSASLKQHALAGNALFILTDLADPEQTASSRTVTALYQSVISAGERLTVRLVLPPQEGFAQGHTYRLRIVQLLSGKEVNLAEGMIGLL